jgi:hypothetical protein
VICRIWHGWTAPANADSYEHLLKNEIFIGISERGIPDYRGLQLLRRELEGEVEFVTLMWFDTLEGVRSFAGEDYEQAVVPPQAQALLSRYDTKSQHYEIREEQVTLAP